MDAATEQLDHLREGVRTLLGLLDDPAADPAALMQASANCASGLEELRRELSASVEDGDPIRRARLAEELEQALRLTAVATGRVESERETLLGQLGLTREALQVARAGLGQTGLGEACDVRG